MPVRQQSVTRHSQHPSRNVSIPVITRPAISALAISKAMCISSVETYFDFSFNSARNGYINVVLLNAKDNCSIKPNHDLIPMMSDGRGSSPDKLPMILDYAVLPDAFQEIYSVPEQTLQRVRPPTNVIHALKASLVTTCSCGPPLYHSLRHSVMNVVIFISLRSTGTEW